MAKTLKLAETVGTAGREAQVMQHRQPHDEVRLLRPGGRRNGAGPSAGTRAGPPATALTTVARRGQASSSKGRRLIQLLLQPIKDLLRSNQV